MIFISKKRMGLVSECDSLLPENELKRNLLSLHSWQENAFCGVEVSEKIVVFLYFIAISIVENFIFVLFVSIVIVLLHSVFYSAN